MISDWLFVGTDTPTKVVVLYFVSCLDIYIAADNEYLKHCCGGWKGECWKHIKFIFASSNILHTYLYMH